MVAKTNIERTLKQLNNLYNDSRNARAELYYSKLATIELCGWIEESMDDIVLKCSTRMVKELENRKYVTSQVKRTYGFEYDQHFRKMLLCVFGIWYLEKIEKKAQLLPQLKSTLMRLKEVRNRSAHTHIKGVMPTIDSPSVTLRDFYNIYNGLKEIESLVRIVKFRH